MFERQTSGSCICIFCNKLISVNKRTCPHCARKNPSLWGYSRALRRLGSDLGFTAIITWGCVTLYLITLLIDFSNIKNAGVFNFLQPGTKSLLLFGASGAIPVFELGRWWTLLSSAWLHGSFLHIVLNLLWIRRLANEVAEAFGTGRLVIIYTVATITGSLLSSLVGHIFSELPNMLRGAPISIGASGGLFGLLGALFAYGQITSSSMVRSQALTFAIVMFLFGFITPNIDNWGHFGGFLGGYLISRTAGVNPYHREGLRHLFVAIACLLLTALSIIASIIHGILIF